MLPAESGDGRFRCDHQIIRRRVPGGFSFSRDYSTVAYVNGDRAQFPEVLVAPVSTMAGRALTTFGDQLKDWTIGTREMISWKSTDGATIEGVLHKPADFQSGRRYPLLVIIHGGPTGISRPVTRAARRRVSDRAMAGEGRGHSRAELSRERGLRREVPLAERPESRRRRRVGRAVRRRLPHRPGDRRSRIAWA